MPGKSGGTQKPLKAPKKEKAEMDDDDMAIQAKLKADKAAVAAAAAKLKK